MKRILFAGTTVLAACAQALAADLPPPVAPPPRAPVAYIPAPPPVYNWGGIYIGVNGGYGFGSSEWTDPTNPNPIAAPTGTSGSFNTSGFLVGGTIGANFQANALVFGVEADLDWSNIKGSVSSPAVPPGFCVLQVSVALTVGDTCNTRNTWLGTARIRIGLAADRALFFLTGGGAFGNIEAGLSGQSITTTTYDTSTKFGWTAGGGAEFALGDNWTARIEYLYVDLGSGTCTTGANCGFINNTPPTLPPNDSVKFTASLVRAGFNFKFGGP
jgi:outer membrane immunogenic protein